VIFFQIIIRAHTPRHAHILRSDCDCLIANIWLASPILWSFTWNWKCWSLNENKEKEIPIHTSIWKTSHWENNNVTFILDQHIHFVAQCYCKSTDQTKMFYYYLWLINYGEY